MAFIWVGCKWGCGRGMGGRIFWKSGVFGAWGRGVLEGGWWDGASRAVVSRFLPPCRDVCTTGAEAWRGVAKRTTRAQRGEKGEDGRGEVVSRRMVIGAFL